MSNLQKRINKAKFSKINDLIAKFDHHLNVERGLAQRTRETYCSYVRVFLDAQSIFSDENGIKNLSPKNVYRFLLSYAKEGKPRRSQSMIGSIRIFFRFLDLFDLADGLPSVPYHKSKPPEYLSDHQLQTLLEGCNRNTMQGLRDYTILMLLIHLGLRGSEVSRLTLNDFDWDRGEIIIRGKGSISRMPISQELGDALVDYLKYARPTSSSNVFFTCVNRPLMGLSPAAISNIIRAGLQRAGLNTNHHGAHLLRHSFATQLLAKGKSLSEISMVLRHKNIRTTAIYAHVDFDKLSLVALPWPTAQKEVSHE